VLLLYPPGLDYIAAFFGCLYAGAVAVPAYPPRVNRSLTRLQTIVADAGAALALTTKAILRKVSSQAAETPGLITLGWLTTDDIDETLAAEWTGTTIKGETLAFLQYTSGSTATPRGVMVTHANLMRNEEMIARAFRHTPSSVIVGWLPLYHDMGLVGNVLQPLYVGARCILMPPAAFLQRPLRWLEAISRYQATTSGGPNFAYDLCVRKIRAEQKAGLDLSSWEVAFNGAEPVRPDSLTRFSAAFEACGFRRSAFYPCYGLAEATLIASGGLKGQKPRVEVFDGPALMRHQVAPAQSQTESSNAKPLASCGRPLGGQRLLVVNPDTAMACPPSEVGEVWLAGPSVARGYWNRPAESQQFFAARLADTGEGPFLRTGDLGFLHDGELYITGRLKDVIILRGSNYYPQDVELTAERSHPALRPGGGAAFSVELAGETRLVVVQELEPRHQCDWPEVAQRIRQAVAEEHELHVHSVVLLKAGNLPKTSSGKVQRRTCKAAYELKALGAVYQWDSLPSDDDTTNPVSNYNVETPKEIEAWLMTELAARSGLAAANIEPDQPIAHYGLDSLMAIEMTHRIESQLGVLLPVTLLLRSASLTELAAQIFAQFSGRRATIKTTQLPDDPIAEYPLSPGQQALYFLNQLSPESAAYNIAHAVRARGELNVQAFKRALQSLVTRHLILRTTFAAPGGEPKQRVHPHLELDFRHEDGSAWSETLLSERLTEIARRPLDLQVGPLRVCVISRSGQEHVIMLVVHHIAADLWSLAIMLHELSLCYAAEEAGSRPNLPPVTFQYSDYVRWQEDLLASSRGQTLRDHWQKQLAGELPPLILPADRPRPPKQTDRGAVHSLRLEAALTKRLQALAQAQGATLYMTLLAAFQILLRRWSGQTEFLIGSPTTGRSRAELAGLVGYLVNPVVMRANLGGNPSFRELLERVRATALAAFEHADYPFALLVEQLQPERDPSRSPLVDIMFVMQTAPSVAGEELGAFALGAAGAQIRLGSLALEPLALAQQVALFDLTLTVAEVGGELVTSLQYNSDLFEAATIERWHGGYARLLEAIAAAPDQPILNLPLLTKAERRRLLEQGNTAPVTGSAACLQTLFEAQAARTPTAVAVSCGAERLTYEELNRRANQVGHHLRRLGVGPEVPVGLCLERSLDLVIAVLGVIKAGGAYLPLDPAYPAERLSFLLGECRPPVVVTQERFLVALSRYDSPLLCLDSQWRLIDQNPATNTAVQTQPDNLAYIIHTSGSTGWPKGVMVTHANVTRLLAATQGWFNFNGQDVWTLFHAYTFDFSVWELWGALLTGGRLVVVSYPVSRTPEAFLDLLCREGVTVLNQTPSAFRQLAQVEAKGGQELSHLRLVIFGGEALDLGSLQPWRARHGNDRPQLVNMYGITETTVHVTYCPLSHRDLRQASGSVIGGPIPGWQLYVLDEQFEPAPVGVVGEIYVGGAGLARGYHKGPDLTAERFIPNPFSPEPGARLYRSGDSARYCSDGELEYVGRIDQQVKLRGFRIELGEIEAALLQHPAVRAATVLLREDQPNEKRLVAYVVASVEVGGTELRRHLKERLPEYMAPAALVFLPGLPLTLHGKVDRRRLPAPDSARPELADSFVAPQSEIEQRLAEVWAEVLGFEHVGIEDNFFDLGGDSIRSIRLRALAQEKGLDFSLQQLFQYQTVKQLAQVVTQSTPANAEGQPAQAFDLLPPKDKARLGSIEYSNVVDAYPLTKLQTGLVFHSEHTPDYLIYVTTLHLRAPLDPAGLRIAIKQLLNRHPMLRTSFDLGNFSQPMQLVHQTVEVPLLFFDWRHLTAAQQEARLGKWLNDEMRSSFDWAQSPLLRFHAHRRTDETFQFTLSEPFLDGWSVASLLTELFNNYFALLSGKPAEGAPLVTLYRDYVALEAAALNSVECQKYWEETLRDSNICRLPRRQRAAEQADALPLARLNIPIAPELAESLQRAARAAGAPLKSLLLAAHLKVMSLLSGQADVVTGLLQNGRPETRDGERALGLFLNALPFRLVLPDCTWAELGRHTLAAERELLPYRRYPLAELQRRQGRQAFFDTVFNFTHFYVYQGLRELAGLEVLDAFASEHTYFDLTTQFNLDDRTAELRLALDYRVDRFDASQMEAIGRYYRSALTALARDPDGRHNLVCLLSPHEREQILHRWNDNQTDWPQQGCLHKLIEAQVERTPQAVAVQFETTQLTYQELNERANQLAHHLHALGVGPDTLVGVCAERSLELVVALLGILKAGGAYVPLDPTLPPARLAFMAADAQVSVLLTQERLLPQLPAHRAQVILLDSDWAEIAKQGRDSLVNLATESDLAYVIYTSGSTGQPKGAMNTHRGICNRLLWMQDIFRLSATDRVLQKTPFSFDVSVWEFFWPLIAGAQLVIARPDGHQDTTYLVNLIAEQGITVLHFVPAMLEVFLEEPGLENCQSIRQVLCSGETLSADLQARFFARSRAELHNLYGPTEAAVDVTHWVCDRHNQEERIPLGRPIANTQIHILDRHLQPTPEGVAGELHIGGAGLARGYLNRPDLTAAKFIPNPFRQEPGARLYKTGDLACYRPDGNIEFLGRLDHQIKINGNRIELGEIEAALRQHPAVQAAVVAAHLGPNGRLRLVAYFVPADGAPAGGELRAFLTEQLPKYMLPTDFVKLAALPTTPSGKVDRNRLPRPEPSQVDEARLAQLLTGLGRLSDDQAQALLAAKKRSSRAGQDHK
jgi:amino acid adenylation domain-containing protein